jgi:hypothetical protein
MKAFDFQLFLARDRLKYWLDKGFKVTITIQPD